jgi:hypothetical protein
MTDGNGSPPWMPATPDPTSLTTEAVERATEITRREIDALHELHDRDLAAFRDLLEARLNGMDSDRSRLWERAHELTAEFDTEIVRFRAEVERRDNASRERIEQRLADLDRARTVADETIGNKFRSERELILAQLEILAVRSAEQFAAVDGRFAESKTAVDAALAAQKESAGEQKLTVKEQLTSLGQVSGASLKALEDKITDARDRLTTMESLTRGIKEAGGESREERGLAHSTAIAVIAGLSVLIAIASLIFAAVHG